MKTVKLFFIAIVMITSITSMAQVAITSDGSTGDASAMLDVKSTTKGFLPPRLTELQRIQMSNPADGLVIFNTTTGYINFYAAGSWNEISGSLINDVPTVYNPTTGETWMDRNLGASQIATSSDDADAFGDLYQWGRATDGHESRTSVTTSTNATTAVPNDGNSWDGLFITEVNSPGDWLTPQDNTLWQGVSGTNNPCPLGFRLPTEAEWTAEMASWSSQNATGAFASPLKLTVGGLRNYDDGSFDSYGGTYWSSAMPWIIAKQLNFSAGGVNIAGYFRGTGSSVRCIKD
jgi:uncharacterized protein (TIGR02145 family)